MSPNAPARKLNFRPRPIDVFRKLDVIRSKKGLQLDDEVIVQRGVPAQPSGMDSDEEEVRVFRRYRCLCRATFMQRGNGTFKIAVCYVHPKPCWVCNGDVL